MAWSITYVSWLTCVLLLWSCVLWMMRERRPLHADVVALAGLRQLLVVLQYIYSFQAVEEVPGLFPRKEDPCRELASKLLCLLTFWLLLRQALTEKEDGRTDSQEARLSAVSVHLDGAGGGLRMEALAAVVSRMFVKYWIYLCGTMFFFVSFEGKIVLYKVIYMVMFLCCVALYQLNYERWRALLRGFWVAVVVYSMLVLILIYTFQFPSSPHTWSYYSGLSTHRLEDVGLEKFSVPVLFTKIFIPAAFLLVCIIHLHYFHQPFLQLTDLKTVPPSGWSTLRAASLTCRWAELPSLSCRSCVFDEESLSEKITVLAAPAERCQLTCLSPALVSWRLVVDRLSVLFLRLLLSLQRLQHLLWWLLELHIVKLVSSYIIWVCVKEVCLFNLVFVLCVGASLPCRAWRPLLSGVCTVWTCVVTVCKMLYQLNVVQPDRYSSNCTVPENSSSELSGSVLYSGLVDPSQWVGLRKTEGKLLDYLRCNLTMLALLAFEVTIYRHQELYRLRHNKATPPTRTLFHGITRRHLDESVLSCLKYFLNYFYKFGLETCFLLAVNVIGQRMDLFAVGHAFGLIAVLSRRSRKRMASAWPRYCYFVSGMLCVQYLLCIGFPPAACKDYPWRPPSFNLDSNVVKWLFLPDHLTPPNPLFLLYDFLLLLGASLQLQVFEEEEQPSVRILAGDNCELHGDDGLLSEQMVQLRLNTVPDFMMCRSYLDMMKVIIFSYMFWFVLTVIFITGTTRISIFCMGYLVACFYFLLVGGDLLLKPVRVILVYWDCLIGYNVFVITMKNILSILACGFIRSLVANHCWLIQLFSLACTIKGYTKRPPAEQQSSKQCELPSDEAGIIWDGVCFCFLLLQRRVFRSHYFLYVVLDLQNTQLLASRGAELIEAATVKAVRARLEVEKMSMDLLKRQMERIKSRQQKFRRGKEKMLSLKQDSLHADAQNSRKEQKEWWRPWVNHASMVRSGDYYLFETDNLPDKSAFQVRLRLRSEVSHQFVYHAWITDSRTAMRARNNQKKLWKKNSSDRRSRKEVKDAVECLDTDSSVRPAADTVLRRVSNTLRFCWVLLSALLDSLTAWLKGLCQEHIDISTVLRMERSDADAAGQAGSRRALRLQPAEDAEHACPGWTAKNSGSPVLTGGLWSRTPPSLSSHEEEAPPPPGLLPPSYSLALGLDLPEEEPVGDSASSSCPLASHVQALTASELLRNRTFCDEELESSDRFYSNQHQLFQLCYAIYNILAARSETVCYLVIVLNHMVSASCLTLVLPVLVFLWATLSVPRPSKTFWMTAIVYTEVAIVIKYFFQFGFFPFNQKLEVDRVKPFHPPNILGVEKKEGYVLYDLLQLLALFYHRAILKVRRLLPRSATGCGIRPSPWRRTRPVPRTAGRTPPRRSTSPTPRPRLCGGGGPGTAPAAPSSRRWQVGSGRTVPLLWRRWEEGGAVTSGVPVGSGSSRAQPPGRLRLLLEKLREASVRARIYSLSRCAALYRPVLHFFRALVQPEYSAVTDVYVLMFLADTVDFIIIVFGFWAFGKHSAAADITSSLSEDQVPEAFLVMVLIQFVGTMVIDRALYLRKTVLGKLVFQVILVLGIHFWMFFILPTVTERRRFNQNLVAQLWYFVKCVYFGLSAYQIRSGYPTRVLGNFLTKSHNYLNLFLFHFRLVPFLTELRAVMDWVWTDTTLSLSSWICVEDVYAHCFVLKCWRESEKRYPQPRGQKKKRVVKYGMGGLIVLLLICIVWFPLLFMSLIKSVAGVLNRPLDVSLTITLGGFQPIFTMSAQQNQLKDLTEAQFLSFTGSYSYTPSALQFLEAYNHEDVTVAELQGSSNSLWTISPPSRQYLSQVLHLDQFPLTVSWTIQRNLTLGAKAELASGKHVTYLDDGTRLQLIQLLNGSRTLPVFIPDVFPCFIRAPSDSNAKPIEQLYTESDERYKGILLALERTNQSAEVQEWWVVDQPETSLVPLLVFSDKVSPPSLGFLAERSIMGLYASVVLVIGKFVREFFSGISHSIMFEELPCVDRILKLCTDIFLVRETGELELEEELYAKLIFLYRSPETLIKWTRR
uniref:Piezo-type mechanosensitive ion channel component 2a, tandem duplicate 2 n=1 Tax=Tetraodon nigroviridis TaxID=99883 RepID=H3D7M7_TETNG